MKGNVYVAVNEDLDIWCAETKDALIRTLEDECGGYYSHSTPTHYVQLNGSDVREAFGWALEWHDGTGGPGYCIYIKRVEVKE